MPNAAFAMTITTTNLADHPLGLESGVVCVVPYNSAWPELFRLEREAIDAALRKNGIIAAIEHIGSTSVPGLAAKPILDTLVGVDDASDFAKAITTVQEAGYIYRGEQGISGRHFFRRGIPRQYHIHLIVRDSELWRDYLSFRDHLRAHSRRAKEYSELKYALAERYPRDRESYIEAKTDFVKRVLKEASSDHMLGD
jgi:GrpB-like predicted nucleotidyltransferase (UPF0157 family)